MQDIRLPGPDANDGGRRWLGVVEGYYGPPLDHDDREWLVGALANDGFTTYAYAPKDDPFHRARWREPYDGAQRTRFAQLIARGSAVGVDVAFVISPGLDWRGAEDHAALGDKLADFADLGGCVFGVAFDDVAPGGADLGASHGAAVAAAAARVGSLAGAARWIVCPTDYAVSGATAYLTAFMAGLPAGVEVMWTGGGIVSLDVSGAQARRWADDLGRRPLFAENFPVNDGTMDPVLHLGPYPHREADLIDEVTGVICNLMPKVRASRVGLQQAARWWRDPGTDREGAWSDAVAAVPGLEPLARAVRGYAADPGPDPSLARMLRAAAGGDAGAAAETSAYLRAGCRAGLEATFAAEVEPWLAQWEAEAAALSAALDLLADRPGRPAWKAFALAEVWRRARATPHAAFGIRFAHYPVTRRAPDGSEHQHPSSLVIGDNLTDEICTAALG